MKTNVFLNHLWYTNKNMRGESIMMSLLVKKWIKNYDQIKDSHVREQYGRLTSSVGILTNVFLFIGKFITGLLVNSVSIQADAINNLSDAGSSVISLISFKLSSKPADKEHPYGHARYETIASVVVAVLILLLGVDLMKTSYVKIVTPETITFSIFSIGVLILSIVLKFWMYTYNKKYGKLLKSNLMQATAMDSLSDVLATSAVLFSTILSPILHFQLDGYMGIVVAFCIMKSGYEIVKDALDVLLGKAPDKEFVDTLIKKINTYDGVLGIHDLIVHDYGPQRTFASVHVEVDGHKDVFSSHDMIDNIERDVQKEFQMNLVIHMDPINTDDELTNDLKHYMSHVLLSIHPELTLHDFRIVSGDTHINLIFDVLIPYDETKQNSEILNELDAIVKKEHPEYFLVITFDRAYVSL